MRREFVFDKFPVDIITVKDFIDKITEWAMRGVKKEIYYTNVHSIVTSARNNKLLKLQVRADIIYPDGFGPILALKKKAERVNAADFINPLLAKLEQKKIKIYLLGESEEINQKTALILAEKYKKLKIIGRHSGFFDHSENKKLIREIRTTKPDLVLIGMGTPKQENWVADNLKSLPTAVYWCVGGLFNYIAGNKKRAPNWMMENSLEWAYRLYQEPGRLFYRYVVENIIFAIFFIKYYLRLRIVSGFHK